MMGYRHIYLLSFPQILKSSSSSRLHFLFFNFICFRKNMSTKPGYHFEGPWVYTKNSKFPIDLGGSNNILSATSPGTFLLATCLPLLLYFLFFTCNDKSGCPAPALLELRTISLEKLKAQIPWPENGLKGFASWEATSWVLAYYFLNLLLHRILPAQEVLGTKLRESGRPLKYRFNGKDYLLP